MTFQTRLNLVSRISIVCPFLLMCVSSSASIFTVIGITITIHFWWRRANEMMKSRDDRGEGDRNKREENRRKAQENIRDEVVNCVALRLCRRFALIVINRYELCISIFPTENTCSVHTGRAVAVIISYYWDAGDIMIVVIQLDPPRWLIFSRLPPVDFKRAHTIRLILWFELHRRHYIIYNAPLLKT